MPHKNLTTKALHALAGLGDVYTDARECSAAVAAAENLAILAQHLPAESDIVLTGQLLADENPVCDAQVSVDGTLLLQRPVEYLPLEATWRLRTADGLDCLVTRFPGECLEDTKWVVAEASTFYAHLTR